MDPQYEIPPSKVRDLAEWTYQQRTEAAMGLAIAARAERRLGHIRTANELDGIALTHERRMVDLHARLWPADPDPEARCKVPDLLEVFQVIVAAIEYCDLFTDAPEKISVLQWLAPYIERAERWIGSNRITAGLAAIPKRED